MTKLYARDVRQVLQRERTTGATFDAAWTTAMDERPTPADWTTSVDGETPIAHMRRLFSLAYIGHEGVRSALSSDLLPLAKDATPKVERTSCRSRCSADPLPGDKFCAEHRVILDRVRAEIGDAPVSGYMIVDFDDRAEMAA